ncbi:hypothetical protein IW262DRAFT_182908 [Armillaria fumosa]|nr:hypothetical protein IW262DRAFT_182908 [Armillaria fumosa]
MFSAKFPSNWLHLYLSLFSIATGLPRTISFITLIPFATTSSYTTFQSFVLILRALRCPASNGQPISHQDKGSIVGNCTREGFACHQCSTEEYWCVGHRLGRSSSYKTLPSVLMKHI